MNNGKRRQEIHSTKMDTDRSAKNNANAKKKYLSKLSAQAQKFGILFKKGFKGHP